MRALVLGAGPAGLLAAHALVSKNHDVVIVSRKRKSELHGAQYLHREIPGLDLGAGLPIAYRLNGTADAYRSKVYGAGATLGVSPEELGADHFAWNIRLAYGKLWEMYREFISDEMLDAHRLFSLLSRLKPEFVVSSLPAPALCDKGHSFTSQRVYAIGDAPERGVYCPVKNIPLNTVVCNGEPDPSWYRASYVYGYRTAEWPYSSPPSRWRAAEVVKPLHNDCDCWPGVLRVGRYGAWQKGVLSHSAYESVLEAISVLT